MGAIDFIMIAGGYLLGSIPFGSIIYYIKTKGDIRKEGSGNVGATNVARNSGALAGVVTLLLDILKGFIPVAACGWVGIANESWTVAIVAIAAILGHMFPVWLKFQGGKGVATAVGIFAALSWQILIVIAIIFFTTFFTFKIVSLASILGAAAFGILSLAIGERFLMPFNLQIAAAVAAALIIVKHHENIGRLLRKEEKKISFKKKAK